MSSEAWTAAELAKVRDAIARGEQSVQFSDRLVTYRTIDDLIKAEQRIAGSRADRVKQTLVYSDKGL